MGEGGCPTLTPPPRGSTKLVARLVSRAPVLALPKFHQPRGQVSPQFNDEETQLRKLQPLAQDQEAEGSGPGTGERHRGGDPRLWP